MSHSFNITYEDTPDVMRRKAIEFMKELRREKYEILLKFINTILEDEIKSFSKFKKIDLAKVFENEEKIKMSYENFSDSFATNFKITLSTSDLTLSTFIKIFTTCLKSIGYKLKKTKCQSTILYSVDIND